MHFILGVIAPKPYNPPKRMYKRHILGMPTSPRNDSCHPKLCCLSCTLVTSTHPKYCFRGQFFGLAYPTRKFRNLSRVYAPADTFTPVVSNMVEIGCIGDRKKQNAFWRYLMEPLGAVPPPQKKIFFYATAHCRPTLIFQVSSKSV